MSEKDRPQLQRPDYVVLVVEDLDRAVAFWVDLLGLSLGHRSDPFVQLDTGETRLALYQREAMAKTLDRPIAAEALGAPAFEIGFVVEDVDGAFAWLVEAGAEPVTPPTTRPWGQRTAYIADPDGHLVELAQQLERPSG